MSNELKVTGSLRFRKDDVDIMWLLQDADVDITNERFLWTRMTPTNGVETALDIAGLTANQKGYAIFRNPMPKAGGATVTLRCDTGAAKDFCILKPQQIAVFPMNAGQTYLIITSAADTHLDYLIVEK